MKNRSVFISSDYAAVDCDHISCYYGYEEIVCEVHGTDWKACNSSEDCDKYEWAFVAKDTAGNEILRIPTNELPEAESGEPYEYLILGMAKTMATFLTAGNLTVR